MRIVFFYYEKKRFKKSVFVLCYNSCVNNIEFNDFENTSSHLLKQSYHKITNVDIRRIFHIIIFFTNYKVYKQEYKSECMLLCMYIRTYFL